MKKAFCFVISIALVLCVGTFVFAQTSEHPKGQQEHPQKQQQEHPKQEHPKGMAKPMSTDDIDKAIRASITEQSKADGMFHVKDAVLNKTWNLSLVKVHKDKLTPLSADTYFACVDFKADDGTMVDVDFFLKGDASNLAMTDTTVHKVNGQARYMYQEKDGFWVRVDNKEAAKEHPAKEHPAKEHPKADSSSNPQ